MQFNVTKLTGVLLRVILCIPVHGREWHVSPKKLTGINADVRLYGDKQQHKGIRPRLGGGR
jgi:hypothetical protein